MPSQRLLSKYKNFIKQNAGINEDVLHWMNQCANAMTPPLTKEGRSGGLI